MGAGAGTWAMRTRHSALMTKVPASRANAVDVPPSDDDPSEGRPHEGEPGGLARAVEGVALGQELRRQELRHDGAVGRIEEGVSYADDGREDDQFRDVQCMGHHERGDRGDRAPTQEIRSEDDQAPRKPIDEGAGKEQEQRVRHDPCSFDVGQRGGVVADPQRLEGDGDRVDAVTEHGHRLTAPQEGEVAVAKRSGHETHSPVTLSAAAPLERPSL